MEPSKPRGSSREMSRASDFASESSRCSSWCSITSLAPGRVSSENTPGGTMGRTRRKPLRATGDGVVRPKGETAGSRARRRRRPARAAPRPHWTVCGRGWRGVRAESEVARPGQNRVRSVQVSDDRAGAVGASRGEGRAVQAAAREMLIGAPPPPVFFGGRLWPSDELSAMAAGWLETLHAPIPPEAELTALPLANHPEAIALFFALSSFPLPVVVLPADPRGWRTAPPLPPATPIFLPPSLAALAGAGVGTGLCTITLPDGGPPVGATPPIRFLATPGMVNFTSGSTGLPKPVFIRTRSFELQTAAIVSACQLEPGAPVAGSLPLAMHYGPGPGAPPGRVPQVHARTRRALRASTVPAAAREPRVRVLGGHAADGGHAGSRAVVRTTPGRAADLPHQRRPAVRARVPGFPGPLRRDPPTELRPDRERVHHGGHGPEERFVPVPSGVRRRESTCASGTTLAIRCPSGRLGRVWFKSPWYMDGYGFTAAPTRDGRDGWWPTQDLGSLDETSRLTLGRRANNSLSRLGYLLREPGRDRGTP